MKTPLSLVIPMALLVTLPLLGCRHDPNAGISKAEAKKTAQSLHPPAPPFPPSGLKPGDPGKPVMIALPVDGPGKAGR